MFFFKACSTCKRFLEVRLVQWPRWRRFLMSAHDCVAVELFCKPRKGFLRGPHRLLVVVYGAVWDSIHNNTEPYGDIARQLQGTRSHTSVCLDYSWPAISLRSPYPARIPFAVLPPDGGRRRPWDFRTDSRALRGSAASTILFRRKLYKFEKNRKPVVCGHVVGIIAQSPHGYRAEDSRWSCSKRTIFRWTWGQKNA